MLETLMEKLQLDYEKDTVKTALLKGMGVGALEGLVIVGAVHVIHNVIAGIKK